MSDAATKGQPDAYLARQVEAMAGYGIPAGDIATALGIERWMLERDYKQELAGAAIKANSKVAENLYRKATGEGREAVTAAIFWLKTRAGWRETSVHEVRTERPLSEWTDQELEERMAFLQHLIEQEETAQKLGLIEADAEAVEGDRSDSGGVGEIVAAADDNHAVDGAGR